MDPILAQTLTSIALSLILFPLIFRQLYKWKYVARNTFVCIGLSVSNGVCAILETLHRISMMFELERAAHQHHIALRCDANVLYKIYDIHVKCVQGAGE